MNLQMFSLHAHSCLLFCMFINGIKLQFVCKKYLTVIPEQFTDWRPDDHKFSIGDIVRHLGSTELMFLSCDQTK
ncbi:hypothetical protein [Brevibacillus laterosporus]|uniref:hypothetical protein n=1 Tax=Brevibacillus laterosporus TaxID=1465 RepID=UPI001F54F9BE|nr:hypothetical protein [Brevibacillus laterosporus]MED1910406.1 hypothetical protein [Brevibacillus laterosporus]